jgi:Gpi18-like mannosyltransferase/predicted membrane-bound dolichyl-phosphate-mannose-protein mannosyltransferase
VIDLIKRYQTGVFTVAVALGASWLQNAIALADEGAPMVSAANKAAGVLAGLMLAALLGYALYAAARALPKSAASGLWRALVLLLALLAVKSIAVAFAPGLRVDVNTFEAWALNIAHDGPAAMYRSGFFLDYPPGYLYALWAAGAVARAVNPSEAILRVIIETPALIADFLLAALMFVTVRRRANAPAAWLAMLLVALNPALLFDTVAWGQSDSVLTLVMLLSVVMLLDDEVELGWGLAALALLIKPQALMLMPVLGVWTLRQTNFRRWWRSALAFLAVVIVGAAPFQVSHPWNWLPELYRSTAAYYHETSVNAFNLMALLGGLRQNDSQSVFGISWFALGLALLVPLYGATGWMIWRNPTRRNLWMAAFLALFGFFMLAPRMHERYVYPAVVFAIPLVLEEPPLVVVFVVLTLTALFNLAYVLHALNTTLFLDPRDGLAMTTAIFNCLAFGAAAVFGLAPSRVLAPERENGDSTPLVSILDQKFRSWRSKLNFGPPPVETYGSLAWTWPDSLTLVVLVTIAAALRFWHIWAPAEIVFDEVHFVGQARHYLHGEPFLDPHPPLAKLLIAAGIALFGDHSGSWRLGNATLGTIMVAVTYLLGRRMFRARPPAAIAAALVGLDGFFLVDSRIGCIDIVYLTFAAIAYWLMFAFIQTPDIYRRRKILIALGVILGLCLGSKLYVPAMTFLLVWGFVAFVMWRPQAPTPAVAGVGEPVDGRRFRRTLGASLLVGSLAAMVYVGCFAPHYILGWWGGIADLLHYYKDVMWYEKSVSTATHPYASRWWSWPLMMRPVAYWQNFPPKGPIVATIWGAGNPLTWVAVIPAIAITAMRALEQPTLERIFLVCGFLGYYLIWIPIGRILFLYHYMPSVYLGYLALGAILAELWKGQTQPLEDLMMLAPIVYVAILGIGHVTTQYDSANFGTGQWIILGIVVVAVLIGGYLVTTIRRPRWTGRFVFVAFATVSIAIFLYYLPIWLGIPITREGYYARMWFEGPGKWDWI